MTAIASRPRWASDELFRRVFKYDGGNEPDIKALNKKYGGYLRDTFYIKVPEGVYPLNSMKYYMVDRIDEILVRRTWPREVGGAEEDPSLVCYDDPPYCD